MIKCVQQIGYTLGKRQVFDFDKVYKVEGDKTLYLGHVGHAENVHFLPRIKLTDAEKRDVVEAVNAHRAREGRGPIKDTIINPLNLGEVAAMVRDAEAVEDDDE